MYQSRGVRHGVCGMGAKHLAFIEAAAAATGPECLRWPFGGQGDGRGVVYSVEGGRRVRRYASRVVCEAAYGPAPSPSHEAAHNCGKGHLGCVNGSHLRWDTHAGNKADQHRHGVTCRRKSVLSRKTKPVSAIVEAQVVDQLRAGRRQREIAEEFGLRAAAVSHIGKRNGVTGRQFGLHHRWGTYAAPRISP